jgi:orotidine-5'-phosphate decarboxylase
MNNPIYCALDTSVLETALGLARAVAPHVGGLKLGMEFFNACGPDGVRRVAGETGLGIFLDLKLHDIPNTVGAGLRALMPLGLAIINVHASGGHAMLRAAADAKQLHPDTKVIGVTVLTSLDDADLGLVGMNGPASVAVARLADLSRSAGLDGIVCSSHEVAAARASWSDGYFVVPGIRPVGSDVGDQKRVMTPRAALDAGASVLVIGRPITAAADPAHAAAEIAAGLT